MSDDLAAQAALNNAIWCDAVCREHGMTTSFSQSTWAGRPAAPALYPNVITLSRDDIDEQIGVIVEVGESLKGQGWAVKDSFSRLDLSAHGFETMFDAQWVNWEEPRLPPSGQRHRVVRVDSSQELRRWESAWAGGVAADATDGPVFRPSLLSNPDIAFLAVIDRGEFAAGLVANRGAEVVGVSNTFVSAGHDPSGVSACLADVGGLWPGLALVSYRSGQDSDDPAGLPNAREIGALRVWRHVGSNVA